MVVVRNKMVSRGEVTITMPMRVVGLGIRPSSYYVFFTIPGISWFQRVNKDTRNCYFQASCLVAFVAGSR